MRSTTLFCLTLVSCVQRSAESDRALDSIALIAPVFKNESPPEAFKNGRHYAIDALELSPTSVDALFDFRERWSVTAIRCSFEASGDYKFELYDCRSPETAPLISFSAFVAEPTARFVIGLRGASPIDNVRDGRLLVYRVDNFGAHRIAAMALAGSATPPMATNEALDTNHALMVTAGPVRHRAMLNLVTWSWNGRLSTFWARQKDPRLKDGTLHLGTIGLSESDKALIDADLRLWPSPVLGISMSFDTRIE